MCGPTHPQNLSSTLLLSVLLTSVIFLSDYDKDPLATIDKNNPFSSTSETKLEVFPLFLSKSTTTTLSIVADRAYPCVTGW
jgi:hypothetical protein